MREKSVTEHRLGLWDWGLAGALVCLVLAAGSWYVVPGAAGAFSDDGVYLATAKALAEGRGYCLVNLPGEPPQTKYPIGYPALLAGLWRFHPDFPANLVFLKDASLALAGLAVGLAFLYLRRFGYADRAVAFGGCLLAATAPFFLYLGALTLSEPYFALLVVLALWALERALATDEAGKRAAAVAGILAATAFLCRLSGLMLVLAGAFLLWRRGRRSLVPYLAGAGALVIPWIAWVLTHRGQGQVDPALAYYSDYLGWWLDYGPVRLARVGVMNLLTLLQLMVTMPALGLFKALESVLAPTAVILPIVALGVVTLWRLVRGACQGRALPVVMAACLGLQLAWPWPLARFLAPFLPFFGVYLLQAVQLPARTLRGKRRLLAAGGLAVSLLVAGNLRLAWQAGGCVQACGYPVVFATTDLPAWDSYRDVFRWVETHVPKTAVLASGMESMTYLYTGRVAVRPFLADPLRLYYGVDGPPLGDVAELLHRLRALKVDYLVRVPMPAFNEEKPLDTLLDSLETSPHSVLRQIYSGADPRFKVYALDWSTPGPAVRRNETAGALAVQGLPPH